MINTCPDIAAPVNGSVTPDQTIYDYQAFVEFDCDTGYTLTGEVDATCLPDGTWDNDPPSCGKSYFLFSILD